MKTDTREASKTIKKSIMLTKPRFFDGFGRSCYFENLNFLKLLGPPGPRKWKITFSVNFQKSQKHRFFKHFGTVSVFYWFTSGSAAGAPGNLEI